MLASSVRSWRSSHRPLKIWFSKSTHQARRAQKSCYVAQIVKIIGPNNSSDKFQPVEAMKAPRSFFQYGNYIHGWKSNSAAL